MSLSPGINPLRKVWQVWKSLRLPWRKRMFVGQDIQGNTYYELRQPRGDTTSNRRLVHYPRSTELSEVRVPPAWHQWLRHQRLHPPTMPEQMAEVQRQARIKVLAAEADARWKAKPSFLNMPEKEDKAKELADQPTSGSNKTQVAHTREEQVRSRESSSQTGSQATARSPADENDPWKRAGRGAPGQEWQPEAWAPPKPNKR